MDKTDKVKKTTTNSKQKKNKKQKQNTVMGHCPHMMLSNRAQEHIKRTLT
jgi:hypothetical protein